MLTRDWHLPPWLFLRANADLAQIEPLKLTDGQARERPVPLVEIAYTEGSTEEIKAEIPRVQKSGYGSISGYRTVESHHTLVTTRLSPEKMRKAGADIKEFRLPRTDDDTCDVSSFTVPNTCNKKMGVDDKRFIDYNPDTVCYVSCPALTLEMEFEPGTEILDLADTTDHPILVR